MLGGYPRSNMVIRGAWSDFHVQFLTQTPHQPHVNPKSVVKILNSVVKYRSFQVQIMFFKVQITQEHLIHLGLHILCCCCHKVNPSSNKALLKPTTYITFLLNFEGGEPLRRGGLGITCLFYEYVSKI